MSEATQKKSFAPHIGLIAIIALAIVLVFVFFPSEEPKPEVTTVPQVIEPEVIAATDSTSPATAINEFEDIATEELELPQVAQEAEIIADQAPIEIEEIIEQEEVPETTVDISDGTIKQRILSLATSNVLGHLLVNQDLLNRFVVFTDNLARDELADNHQLLQRPQNKFRVYQQAGKSWIDAASYRRYSVYSQAFESVSAEGLIELYYEYKPEIQRIYDEISSGNDFDDTLLMAIDHVLDTPEIRVPVAVESESVMYQYADRQLENLSAPQKQLLRAGPENMRIIKAKLREIAKGLRQSV